MSEQTIGQRLRGIRKRQGLTQAELAAQVGMAQPVLSRYERGELRMHAALVAAFAGALKTTSDEILGIKPTSPDGPPAADRRVLRRLELIQRLPKGDRLALLKTIDAVLKSAS